MCVCVCVFPRFLPPLAIRRLLRNMGNTFIIVFSLKTHTYMLYMCLHESVYTYICTICEYVCAHVHVIVCIQVQCMCVCECACYMYVWACACMCFCVCVCVCVCVCFYFCLCVRMYVCVRL